MDFREKKDIPSPREKASFLSKLFFLWIIPLFRKGSSKDLTIDDMYNVPTEDISHKLGIQLGKLWDEVCTKAELKGKKAKYYKAVINLFGKRYILLGLALLFDECVIRVAQPIFLRLLIRSFSDQSITESEQYLYAAGVCFTSLIHSVIIHPLAFDILHIGMKCRISTCSLIYRKTMRLSRAAQEQTTVGQLINLLSNDVNRFDMNLLFIPYLIIGPIQTLIFMYFLWEELGVSCVAGIGIVFLLMPVQYYIGTLSRMLRHKIAQKADERGRIMNEIIMAIRVIKMYAWEMPFSSLINQIRREEVKVLRKRAYLRSFYLSLFLSSKKLIPYLTFLVYVLFGHTLSADKVFFAVSIFDVVIFNMISTLPSAAAGCGELVVAIKRIEDFLLLDEKKLNKSVEIVPIDFKNENMNNEEIVPFVRMQNVTASWNGDKFNLDQVTVNLTGNKLVMIVGPVGCGKSSFLQVLLQELPIASGKCSISGKIAYSCQDPWVFSGNVRQNILFGKMLEEDLYENIISACALESDFYQLPQGDSTLVGERGITLSGGQKARVNLARALYQEADLYLLDDPLSAVDSRVSRHIFEKCIKKYLNGSLRILVTHQLQYLPQADHVIVMHKGQVLAQGTYKELVEEGIDFVKLIMSEAEVDLYRKASLTKMVVMEEEIKKEEEILESQVEKMAVGSVSLKTYWEYYRSGDSLCGMILVFLGFIFSQILYTASDYWLSHWTNAEELWAASPKRSSQEDFTSSAPYNATFEDNENDVFLNTTTAQALSFVSDYFKEDTTNTSATFFDSPSQVNKFNIISSYLDRNTYILVYSALVFAIALATNINSAYFFRYCMRISINVHNKMFGSLVRAPVKFFDENPSGRVMNRFTKDLCSMDESLPSACFDVITIFLVMLGVIIVVILSNYYVIIPSTLLVIALWIIRRFYIRTARDVKRIEAITRSPLFTHMTASIQGLTTIRALRTERILIQQFDGHQDIHSAAWFLFISSNRWFGIWLEMISVTFLTIVTFSFLLIAQSTKSGYVGLAISSVLSVTFKFQWGMRQSAEMENLMTSVERCLEYIKVIAEAPLESTPKNQPRADWPKLGEIRFEKVSLAYDDKEVLQDLSFEISAKEKIGIVGRTGAGKSSIIAALFRMTEPHGDIYIDDVRTKDIGLHDLRKNISIIPQDPVLFSGTVRYNLDPFGQFKDSELWQVLEDVHLKDAVAALDLVVNDGGTNFSLGQRQLVCLARAILRNNKIIVMDEATANVDPGTDRFIQDTIREKFADCTIITIAHRLNSVMDCDKILVLESGCLQEYDHPHNLLQDADSILSSMARHTGKSSHMYLKSIALTAYKKKFQAVI